MNQFELDWEDSSARGLGDEGMSLVGEISVLDFSTARRLFRFLLNHDIIFSFSFSFSSFSGSLTCGIIIGVVFVRGSTLVGNGGRGGGGSCGNMSREVTNEGVEDDARGDRSEIDRLFSLEFACEPPACPIVPRVAVIDGARRIVLIIFVPNPAGVMGVKVVGTVFPVGGDTSELWVIDVTTGVRIGFSKEGWGVTEGIDGKTEGGRCRCSASSGIPTGFSPGGKIGDLPLCGDWSVWGIGPEIVASGGGVGSAERSPRLT